MTAKNKKLKTESRAHRFGAFTRRLTIGKAKSLKSVTLKATEAIKSTAVEIKNGFTAES
jgi:hypothetical protein